jgi:hypothetical protein
MSLHSINLLVFAMAYNTVVYLLKARTVEPEKEPLLSNARMQQ